jgi:hypothetical protein
MGPLVRSRAFAALALATGALCVLAAAGCDDGDDAATDRALPPVPPPDVARRSDVEVIRAWSDALRAGDVAAASRYFALPATVENGPPAFRLVTVRAVRFFNASLPCGAKLLRTRRHGSFTIATFRLTERPGRGECGDGTGNLAATAFKLRDRKIIEWRRVEVPGEQRAPGAEEV